MEIVCKKCRHPNKLGAIFCRECGAKLELSDIDPATLRRKLNPPKFPWRKVFATLIVLALAGLLYLLFVPVGWETPELSDNAEDLAAARAVRDSLTKTVQSGKAAQVSGSCEAFSLLLSALLNGEDLADTADAKPAPSTRLVLETADDGEEGDNGELLLTLRSKAFGFLPLLMERRYHLEKGRFAFVSMRIGKVDVPAALNAVAGSWFWRNVALPGEYGEAMSRLNRVENGKDGRLVVVLNAATAPEKKQEKR